MKQAVLSLLVNDEVIDKLPDLQVATMVNLIKMEFENEYEMFDWTKDIYEKVRILKIIILLFRNELHQVLRIFSVGNRSETVEQDMIFLYLLNRL